jgi:hypothetical protein
MVASAPDDEPDAIWESPDRLSRWSWFRHDDGDICLVNSVAFARADLLLSFDPHDLRDLIDALVQHRNAGHFDDDA